MTKTEYQKQEIDQGLKQPCPKVTRLADSDFKINEDVVQWMTDIDLAYGQCDAIHNALLKRLE